MMDWGEENRTFKNSFYYFYFYSSLLGFETIKHEREGILIDTLLEIIFNSSIIINLARM